MFPYKLTKPNNIRAIIPKNNAKLPKINPYNVMIIPQVSTGSKASTHNLGLIIPISASKASMIIIMVIVINI